MYNSSVKIAVLSGKGGTGKTLVSVNLASAAGEAIYVDCDVEEPDGHLFFKPDRVSSEDVTIKIPVVDETKCSGCRKCVDFCKFSALAFIKDKPVVFYDVCHSCGGCAIICPEKAMTEKDRVIGEVQEGVSGGVEVLTGVLKAGEESGVPIIKKLLSKVASKSGPPVIIDCPPGSACVVTESIKDADYCVLVAEPTIFGAHNLEMVYELVRVMGKPFGVVLNKCLEGENPSERFCVEKGIPMIGRIPFDAKLGRVCSDAKIAVDEMPEYKTLFSSLLETVEKEARHETASDS